MEHLDPQETQDTTRICRLRTTSPVQRVRYVRSVGVYSGIMYRCVRYVLRVARVDSGWGDVMLNLTSAAAASAGGGGGGAAATALRTAGWSCSVFFSFSSNSLAKAT